MVRKLHLRGNKTFSCLKYFPTLTAPKCCLTSSHHGRKASDPFKKVSSTHAKLIRCSTPLTPVLWTLTQITSVLRINSLLIALQAVYSSEADCSVRILFSITTLQLCFYPTIYAPQHPRDVSHFNFSPF